LIYAVSEKKTMNHKTTRTTVHSAVTLCCKHKALLARPRTAQTNVLLLYWIFELGNVAT